MSFPQAKNKSMITAALIGLTTLGCAKLDSGKDDRESGPLTTSQPAPGDAGCEVEDGFNFTTAGSTWADKNVSVSFMPDGTTVSGGSSSLFSIMDAQIPRAVWQMQYARALASWSAVSTLNFHFVSDDGSPAGTSGQVQGDTRFGDIRIGTKPMTGTGYSYYPASSGTNPGDSYYKPNTTWKAGTGLNDVYSIASHELGHSLGLGHSTSGTIMESIIYSVYPGLTQDDIDGIQARYGARTPDSYDTLSNNDTVASASSVQVSATTATLIAGDLTGFADVDHYEMNIPAGADSVLSITALGGESFLQPTLRLYNGNGDLLQEVSAGSYGAGALLQHAGVSAGGVFIIAVDSNNTDEFGVGLYRLAVEFRTSVDGLMYEPAVTLPPDSYEVNDTLAQAKNLGTVTSSTFSNLSIHTSADQDYFYFKTNKRSKNYQVGLTLGSGSQPLAIEIFDASNRLVANSNGQPSINFPAPNSTTFKIRVFSPGSTPGTYSMKVVKLN